MLEGVSLDIDVCYGLLMTVNEIGWFVLQWYESIGL